MKGQNIDETVLAKAETSLRAVVKGNPEFVPAYDAMAYVLTLEGGKDKLDEAYMMALHAVSRELGNVQYRIRAVEVLERQERAEDAVRVATLAVSMAKTPEEAQAASTTLAGAQQFQESLHKIRAMQTSESVTAGRVGSANIVPTTAQTVIRQVNASAGVVILSNTQGVDFKSYLSQEVMAKIQREWSVQIQKLDMAAAEKKGTVTIEFAIEKDGSIGQMRLKQSTQEEVLDDAVREAIQGASPFAPLPAKFRDKDITVRFQCDYNQGAPGAGSSGKAVNETNGSSEQ
jgi:TonB family protein